jgi:hypothetical protein
MLPVVELIVKKLKESHEGEHLVASNYCDVDIGTSVVWHIPPSNISVTEEESNSSGSSLTVEPSSPNNERGMDEVGISTSINQMPSQESAPVESYQGERISTHGTSSSRRTVSICELDESGPVTKKIRSEYNQKQERSVTIVQDLLSIAPKPAGILLLAQPKDAKVLSPLHVFVRQQVEVFTATNADIAQPAPGRKNRIQLNQVGLRCIHCRDLPPRDRVKRAVCYPSSVGRVYHSVSDMKFDHFSHCKGQPEEIRLKFQDLKDDSKQKLHKKSSKSQIYSSSTAQYYHDSARDMGMVDGSGGLFMTNDISKNSFQKPHARLDTAESTSASKSVVSLLSKNNELSLNIGKNPQTTTVSAENIANSAMISSLASYLYTMNTVMNIPNDIEATGEGGNMTSQAARDTRIMGAFESCLLTSCMDQYHLNPVHCFVRRHIQVFVTDRDDIAAPAPGRKTRVVLGQVGLRCVHCASLPIKDRVKRAVCYPAAVAGIYHSVSNMKFDHFDKCRGLPESERAIFVTLRSFCGRHGPRNNKATTNSGNKTVCNTNSTAQYYYDSAIALGLIDSENGIRIRDTPVLRQPFMVYDGCNGTNAPFIGTKDSFSNTMKSHPSQSLLEPSHSYRPESSSRSMQNSSTTASSPTDGISALVIAASVRVAAAAAEEEADATTKALPVQRQEIV